MFEQWFSVFCHQLPERSPSLGANHFPVCYRCAGIHIGVCIAVIYLMTMRRRDSQMPSLPTSLLLAFAMCPIWIDGWLNTLGLINTPAIPRYLTGLLFGVSMPLIFLPFSAGKLPAARKAANPSIRHLLDYACLLFVGIACLLMLQSSWGLPFWPMLTLFASTGLIFFFAIWLRCLKSGLKILWNNSNA